MVNEMKKSIEEIPKTLMDICKNLLSRRALIVELLESVTKAEIDVSEVSDKIESLKVFFVRYWHKNKTFFAYYGESIRTNGCIITYFISFLRTRANSFSIL